jgi:hypothetical protein
LKPGLSIGWVKGHHVMSNWDWNIHSLNKHEYPCLKQTMICTAKKMRARASQRVHNEMLDLSSTFNRSVRMTSNVEYFTW